MWASESHATVDIYCPFITLALFVFLSNTKSASGGWLITFLFLFLTWVWYVFSFKKQFLLLFLVFVFFCSFLNLFSQKFSNFAYFYLRIFFPFFFFYLLSPLPQDGSLVWCMNAVHCDNVGLGAWRIVTWGLCSLILWYFETDNTLLLSVITEGCCSASP